MYCCNGACLLKNTTTCDSNGHNPWSTNRNLHLGYQLLQLVWTLLYYIFLCLLDAFGIELLFIAKEKCFPMINVEIFFELFRNISMHTDTILYISSVGWKSTNPKYAGGDCWTLNTFRSGLTFVGKTLSTDFKHEMHDLLFKIKVQCDTCQCDKCLHMCHKHISLNMSIILTSTKTRLNLLLQHVINHHPASGSIQDSLPILSGKHRHIYTPSNRHMLSHSNTRKQTNTHTTCACMRPERCADPRLVSQLWPWVKPSH